MNPRGIAYYPSTWKKMDKGLIKVFIIISLINLFGIVSSIRDWPIWVKTLTWPVYLPYALINLMLYNIPKVIYPKVDYDYSMVSTYFQCIWVISFLLYNITCTGVILKIYGYLSRPIKKKKFEEKEVLACPRCCSLNISGLKHKQFWLKKYGPIMGVYTCQECDYEGQPIIFDSKEDYKKFLEHKKIKNEDSDSIRLSLPV